MYNPLLQKKKQQRKDKDEKIYQIRERNEIIVFVIDGATYNDYQSMSELAQSKNKNIIYGGSYIMNGNDLVHEFSLIHLKQ